MCFFRKFLTEKPIVFDNIELEISSSNVITINQYKVDRPIRKTVYLILGDFLNRFRLNRAYHYFSNS